MNADEHQKQQEEQQMWEDHRKAVRELEQLLDEMGVKHHKLKDRGKSNAR